MDFLPLYYMGGFEKKLVGGGGGGVVVVVARTGGEPEKISGTRRDGVRKQERRYGKQETKGGY